MDKFSYLMRHDISEELVGAMILLKNSLYIITEQYNSFAEKQKKENDSIFPEININCFINTDNKLIIKIDVAYTDESSDYIKKLKNRIKFLETELQIKEDEHKEKLKQKEKEYKQKEEEYEKERKEWERDSRNRAEEWNMIRSLAHSEKSLEKIDEKALAEQIYKELRAEYKLDN